ncbi:glycoside hydrolase family 16 protein [Embleya sp. AB8]|uniref:glycoside hydrolase family 16 protein n=1 Tax=Embleya sp. AB8 TaxID=3156304 RepID=UPI003C743A3E
MLTPLVAVAVLAGGVAFAANQLSDENPKPANGAKPPAGAGQTSLPPTADGPKTAYPAGTLFDSFDYSGPNDPALAAHGWQARDGQGGPGIPNTWSTSGVSFPQVPAAQGGKALQLQLVTDGTKAGTRQAELAGTGGKFSTGTLAARVYFSEKPTSGRNGDHINETLFLMSPSGGSSAKYTELDYEYMPNGGWGAPGPQLDTTSWRSSKPGDRVTRPNKQSYKGWHTLMITAMDGVVTYSIDGRTLFSSNGKEFPREPADIHFSTWLIDLPFTGVRTWNMQVNWVYRKANQTVALKDVQAEVDAFYAQGTRYVDTTPRS